MPTINTYYTDDKFEQELKESINDLKQFAAKELTCGDISLQPDEISIRLIKTTGSGMLAEVELEVTAHAFGGRIKRQDEICLTFRDFLKEKLSASEVRVWLLLPELGHSWE